MTIVVHMVVFEKHLARNKHIAADRKDTIKVQVFVIMFTRDYYSLTLSSILCNENLKDNGLPIFCSFTLTSITAIKGQNVHYL